MALLGYRVIVTRDHGGLAAVSRAVSEVWDAPKTAKEPGFFECLSEYLAERPDIGAVVPVEESYVLGLARNRAKLPPDRIYGTPSDEIVTTCLDKVAMLEVAGRAGVPSAAAQVVETLDQIFDAAARIGFPLIVRPLSSLQPIAGRKAFITQEESVLREALTEWPEGHDRLIVQRFIRGPRFNVDFAAQKGRVIRAVATQILRTDAYDGTGIDVCGKTLPMPDDLREFTARMAAALDYTGVGLIQFMVDRDRDEISFLELNPRFNGNTAVPDRAGLELCRLSIDLAEDPDREEKVFESEGGLRHAWFYGDVQGIRKSVSHGMMRRGQVPGALWQAVRDAVTADFHVIWSWRDPRPGISQFTNSLRNAFR
ncbi:ATP-binding protein [Marimonas lutisalis]|uniref:ATP-binding protein n=1 Tax=Marimonas lutisalis TaxID=2545756 RepID=UPI0013757B9E|nr:ATP-grasp domain-containing protein [Marimonas lutisalis]